MKHRFLLIMIAAFALYLGLASPAKAEAIRELVAIQGADSYWHAQRFAYVGSAIEGPYGPGSHLMQRAIEAI